LLWFVSNDIKFLDAAAKILERQQNGLEFVGATANAKFQLQRDGKDIPFVPLDEVATQNFDVLLVVGAKKIGMSEVVKVARRRKIPDEKLLGDWIVCIPGFTLEKYRKLQRSRLSIFSLNCFGGIISNYLGLPFRSPFVNMFLLEKDFVRFLRAPRVYMEEKLILNGTRWEENLKFDYPIFTLGNVDVHMNHYRDFDEAKKIWSRRKERINWYNLFVTMYTDSKETSRAFDELPFGKKVCFVPFKSDLDSAWYINSEIKNASELWDIVNHFGFGDPVYYDPFDMLLYGKKTQLLEM